MMPNHPMYGQHHYPQEASAWMHPQSHHQHAQQAAAAAAASAAQQAHFNRIATTANHANALNAVHQDGGAENPNMSEDNRRTMQYIADLLNENTREQALLELSKKREQVPELALILWHSFGVMTSLVQEIISVYTLLNPSQLTAAASNRVCNALALLQCVASHNETRTLFLNAHIPLYLYPFLNTTSKSRPFEYLRLTSLGVIGALVKNDSTEVINFLLTTEIIPLCLRIMETGSELSKTVAIFIVQKILLDDNGLNYICATYERFYAVGTVLSNMVGQLVEQQTARLLKHVVRCFLRLSDNARAREALRQCLPEPLRDATFSSVLRDDAATKRCLTQLLVNLSDNAMPEIEGLPRKAAEVVSKPAEEVFPGRIHDDASDQVLEESPPKLAEDSSASSLVNGSLSGPQVEHIEEHNCKEDISDEKYPSRPDEEPANKTGTKSSTDRRDGVDDNAGNDEKVELHRKADEEPINPSDDKPVDLTDKKAVNPKDEEPASPVPPPGPRFRGKKRFKPVPELSSSSNRPTL
ncbi:hypothetical protein VSDG_09804 [Cytospora chrysosperma]|uniref:Cell differentiation protein rcd1 n=1 Tax=Cytospora chrysosperma TaxID=252740 RepID=A0A423V9F4_CYTCH|nr:hypothetical protein VSDG_09804 [Valsa sordida]